MDIKQEIEAMKLAHATPAAKLGNARIRAYIRVSSNSIGQDQRRQLIGFKAFCEGTELRDQTTYLEINSGKGGVIRKKYKDMEKDAKANKFDVLWVEQPSRLGRNVREGLNNMHDLHELGIKVFFQKFNKVFDLNNGMDKMNFLFYMWAAETEHDWNSSNTKNSMKAKDKQLKAWAKENGLGGIWSGGGKSFEKMIIKDPFFKGNQNKRGVVMVEVPYMEEFFQIFFLEGKSNAYLQECFKLPVNPNCKYECWNKKPLPFGGMPRVKGNHDGDKRVTRKEVLKFINDGGWRNYIRSDEQLKKTHPEAFQAKNGERKKRKCSCGQCMSKPTVSTHVKRLVYDRDLAEKRHPHAFERATAKSSEVSIDELGRILEFATLKQD